MITRIKLLNFEIRINQMMKEIEMHSIKVSDYLYDMETNLTKMEAIGLLVEIPSILEDLDELLKIYVESVEEEYAKLYK